MSLTAFNPKAQDGSVTAPNLLAAATVIRRQLCDAGFMPTPVGGKRPVLTGWQNKTQTNPDEIELWAGLYPHAVNTGILTRSTPALDIDVLDPDAADAVEELIRERCGERGRISVRFGRAPKRAVLFRTDTPFRKVLARLTAPNGDDKQQLEFLGDGQQLVARGIHPDTGRPYRWHGGRPGDVHRDELPEVCEGEAQALFDDAVALLVRDHGYRVSEALKKRVGPGNQPRVDWSAAAISEVSALRNVTMASLVGHLLRRHVDPRITYTLVHAWNAHCCKPPKPVSEVNRTLESVAARERKRRYGDHHHAFRGSQESGGASPTGDAEGEKPARGRHA